MKCKIMYRYTKEIFGKLNDLEMAYAVPFAFHTLGHKQIIAGHAHSVSPDDEKSGDYERKRRMQNASPKICAVCGDRATGYNFDAITCESCKAFFRRNAMKDKDYHRCCFGNKCEMTPVSRRFCQKCRLRKCFQVGMKKEWIESEEKLLLRKRKRIEKNKRKSSCPPQITCTSNAIDVHSSTAIRMSTSADGTVSSSTETDDHPVSSFDATKRRSSLEAPISVKKLCSTSSSSEMDNSPNLIPTRDTVIRRASTSSATNAANVASDRRFMWPPRTSDTESRMIDVPETLLVDLIEFCNSCCSNYEIPEPAILEYARSFLTSSKHI